MDSERTNGVVGGVAIIAMAGRFPGARDLETFWRIIRDGVETISSFSDQELNAAGVPSDLLQQSSYVKARGTVDDADLFDASFFGYSPSDALMMDPQQRLFLEVGWEAFERAGYSPRDYRGLIGVYAGATTSSYASQLYQNLPPSQFDPVSLSLGNDLPFLTSRVSYKLDLKGPSYPVQTACSTSLVAVHLACQGLLNSECDLALAGGVSIRMPQVSGYRYQPDGIFSPDGHCRPFDAKAQGTLFSNGLGVVVLKRLEDAIVDRDAILAVIRGSAINNDGARRASFTAPGVAGQTSVIADALASAEVAPDTIGYVESHGTATPLGDAIEIQALTKAFGNGSSKRQYCAVGSVKANIGHLDAAAGIAGLIKTVLALQHRQLPPAACFERPNPDIRFENTPFYVNTVLAEWRPRGDAPRRAGVSAFGFGGTNAHLVLEEAPQTEPPDDSRSVQLLTFSAETEEGLRRTSSEIVQHLQQHAGVNFADAAYTLKVGRHAFRHRQALVCRNADEAAQLLARSEASRTVAGYHDGATRNVVFRFGSGAIRNAPIDRQLYESEAAFRNEIDHCVEELADLSGVELRDRLFASAGERGASSASQDPVVSRALPFIVQYAVARLLMSWGVQPAACIGNGSDDDVAACVSGRLPLREALRHLASADTVSESGPARAPAGFSPDDEPFVLDIPFGLDRTVDLTSLLRCLASTWVAGVQIEWSGFYARERRYRVALPTYPFDRRRYAIERSPRGGSSTARPKKPVNRNPLVREWFYAPVWMQMPLALPLAPTALPPGVWIVFADEDGVGVALGDRLRRDGHEVVTVTAGDRFGEVPGHRFTIDARSAGDYERLLEEVTEGDRNLSGIVHAWGIHGDDCGDVSDYQLDLERVFGSVLLLAQALGRAASPVPVRITVLTTGVQAIIGTETLAPGRATVLGLRHVIAQEYPQLVCKAIDLDASDLPGIVENELFRRQLLYDATLDSSAAVVAYRGGSRWIQKYTSLSLPEPEAGQVPPQLRPGGVYLITGGLGEIGLAIAEYLARTTHGRLVLTGRSPLPPAVEWDSHAGLTDPTARRIARLRAIGAHGSEVLTIQADVADRGQMAAAFAAAERQFGRVDGVIHAAGVMGADTFKPIALTDPSACSRQFHPKVDGLVVLDELLRDRDLDFCLLISSLSAVLGGLGYGAYASANVFLDAMARARSRSSRFPWYSINWDAWLRSEEEAALARAGAAPSGFVMTQAQGINALHHILSSDAGVQIVVSTGDLQSRLDQWIAPRVFEGVSSAAPDLVALPRPKLRTAYVPADGGLERTITEAFRQGLGLEQVGVHDNFFELGGHSLKAIEIAARLQSQLGTEVRVTMFYEAPTAALLARSIESRHLAGRRFDDVARRAENRLQRLEMRRRGTPA